MKRTTTAQPEIHAICGNCDHWGKEKPGTCVLHLQPTERTYSCADFNFERKRQADEQAAIELLREHFDAHGGGLAMVRAVIDVRRRTGLKRPGGAAMRLLSEIAAARP